ncbi:MAG: hypothetical protein V3575_05180 [Candidatus Absconditabacteria bacterium]
MNFKVIKKLLFVILFALSINFSFGLSKINFSRFADWISQTNSIVHFGNLGNDLGGLIFVTGQKSIPGGVKVQGINCLQQLKGYYSVGTMGLTLLPLDNETLVDFKGIGLTSNLQLDGGLYTMCEGYQDSIIGQVKLTTSTSTRYITSGVKLDYKDNSLVGGLTNSFQFYNKRPIGLVHDSLLGIGFIGGKVNKTWTDTNSITKQMSGFDFLVTQTNSGIKMNALIQEITKDEIKIKNHLKETGNPPLYISNGLINSVLLKIGVLGSYNVSQIGLGKADFKEGSNSLSQVDSNNNYESFNMGSSNNTQTSFVLNNIQKSSDLLCRNKWKEVTNTIKITNQGLHCYKSNGSSNVEVDTNLIQNPNSNTTIVVSGVGSKLIFKQSQVGKGNLNVFVDKGLLLIDNGINLVNIDVNGNYVATASYTKGAMLRGMFYVRGLISGSNGSNLSEFNHRMYFRGNVVSYNSIYEPADSMKKFLKSLLNNNNIDDFINLQTIFTWSCGGTTESLSSDGVKCGGTSKRASKSLVFINDEINNMFK